MQLRLQKEIEVVRSNLKETELRLQKEIEIVRAQIKESTSRLIKWSFGFWVLQFSGLAGLLITLFKIFL